MTDTAPLPTPSKARNKRWRYGVVAALCVGAIAWMLMLMTQNVVFFKTVSQAVRDEAHDGTRHMRIGGGVVPASIINRNNGVDFQLTDNGITVTVHHTGDEPELFKDCAPVVAEGHWDRNATNTFDSTRLLIKHNNNYEAPKTSATTTCPSDPFK